MFLLLAAFLIEGVLSFCIGGLSLSIGFCEALSVVFLAVNVMIAFSYASKRFKDYDNQFQMFVILSIFLKIALVIWDYYGTKIFILPNSHRDTEQFNLIGAWYATGVIPEAGGYNLVVGLIYKLFGFQRMMVQYFNVMISVFAIDIFEKTLRMVNVSDKTRRTTMILALFLPNYMLFSAILSRECIISVILCFSLYFFIKWWNESTNLLNLIIAFLLVLFACTYHGGAIAVGLGYAVAYVLTSYNKKTGLRESNFSLRTFFFAGIFMAGFGLLFKQFSDSLFSKFQGMDMESIDAYIADHNFYNNTNIGDGSGYTAGFEMEGEAGLVVNSPIRMLYFLWVPMPWMIRGPGDIIAFCFSSLFYGGFSLLGIIMFVQRRLKEHPLAVSILATALCAAFIFAWGVDSAGSALRHREKFFFVYLLLFALVLNVWEKEKEARKIEFEKKQERMKLHRRKAV